MSQPQEDVSLPMSELRRDHTTADLPQPAPPDQEGSTKQKEAEKPSTQSQISDWTLMFSYIVVWSYVGVLIRIYTQQIAKYTSTEFFAALYAQVIGCLCMGFILMHKDAINPKHPALYIGLGTALCGSCTTFSSWMAEAVELVVGYPGSVYVNDSNAYRVLSYFTILWLGFAAPMGIFFFGKDLAVGVSPFVKKPVPDVAYKGTFGRLLDLYCQHEYPLALTQCVVVVGLCLILLGGYEQWGTFFALVTGPFGTLLRYYLGKYLNQSERPYGTFAANMLGCAIYGIVLVWKKETNYSTVGAAVLDGIDNGFCGALTTVSTFVSELTTLKRPNAYLYAVVSVVGGQLIMLITIGVYTWVTF